MRIEITTVETVELPDDEYGPGGAVEAIWCAVHDGVDEFIAQYSESRETISVVALQD